MLGVDIKVTNDANIEVTNGFNTIVKHFRYLYSTLYTNTDVQILRMTHKNGSKHVGVPVF